MQNAHPSSMAIAGYQFGSFLNFAPVTCMMFVNVSFLVSHSARVVFLGQSKLNFRKGKLWSSRRRLACSIATGVTSGYLCEPLLGMSVVDESPGALPISQSRSGHLNGPLVWAQQITSIEFLSFVLNPETVWVWTLGHSIIFYSIWGLWKTLNMIDKRYQDHS